MKTKTVFLVLFFLWITAGNRIYAQYFEDVAKPWGIQHSYILNNAGGGVSFVDFNQDGRDDISLATGKDEQVHFYVNMGGHFNRIGLIENTDEVKTVLWADYDNDGDQDLYLAVFNGISRLYNNVNGTLYLEDVTQISGLPVQAQKCFGAVWGDYNRDGWLDLYYTSRAIDTSDYHKNRLWRNNADGTFTEVSNLVGASDPNKLPFCAAFVDIDQDKWPDIYIANDRSKGNTMLLNKKGLFEDISRGTQTDVAMNGMNVGVADYDNNGYLDIYVTNTKEGSLLLSNQGIPPDSIYCQFNKDGYDRGIDFRDGIGWGANFLDADNDGWQDLYVSGMLIGTSTRSSAFFHNIGDGYFEEGGFGFNADTVRSYTNAIGDIDNDGYPEIMSNNSEYYPSQLWKSQKKENAYLKIHVEGVLSNRDGTGCLIKLYNQANRQIRYTHSGLAFLGQNTRSIIFGLGTATLIDSLEIIWPTGHVDKLYNLSTNQTIYIKEGQTTNGQINVDDDIEIISSLTQVASLKEFDFYPNPASEHIYMSSLRDQRVSRVLVHSFLGDILLDVKLNAQRMVDLSSLRPGGYLITLITGRQKHTKVLIKI